MENHALNLARDLRAGTSNNSGGTCRLCGYHHSANVCPPGKPDKGGGKGNDKKEGGGGGGGKKGGDGGGDKKDCGGGGGAGKKDSGGGGDKKDPKKAIPPKKNEPPNPRPPCVPPAGGGGGGGPDPPDNSGSNADIIPPNISDALCYIVFVLIILAAVVLFYCRGLPSSKSCFGGGKPCKTGSKSDCCAAKTASKSLTSSKLQEQYENFKKSLASQACLSGYAANCPRVPNHAGVVAGARLVSIRDTKNIFSCKCKDSGKVGEVCYPNSGSCSNCKCDEEMKPEVIIQEGGPIVAGKCWAFAGKGKVLIGLYYPIIVTGITLHHPDRALLIPGYFSSAPKTFELWGYKNITDPKPHQFGTFEYAEKDAPVKMYEVQKPADGVFYNYVQFNFLTNHGNKNFTAVYRVEVHGLADT